MYLANQTVNHGGAALRHSDGLFPNLASALITKYENFILMP
jgi:hypothetical protein